MPGPACNKKATMTINFPQPGFWDRFLRKIGKRRGVYVPSKTYEKFGPYIFATARKESFWRSLFRPKDKQLPDGYVDIFDYDHLSDRPARK
jgi:hypothetical protein